MAVRLLCFHGPGDFEFYLWDIRSSSPTWGRKLKVLVGESNRQSVIVPPGVVLAYKNISDHAGWVMNFPNRLYAGEDIKIRSMKSVMKTSRILRFKSINDLDFIRKKERKPPDSTDGFIFAKLFSKRFYDENLS